MKTLLISNIPPTLDRSSGILLHKMCSALYPELAIYTLMHPFNYFLKNSMPPDVPYQSSAIPMESSWRILPSVMGGVTAWLWELHVEKFIIPRIAERIVAFARLHKVGRVWCVLEGQTLIRLASIVAKQLGCSLHSQVFDAPEWYLLGNNIDFFSKRKILKHYDNALRSSASVAAASPIMANQIASLYGIPSYDFVGTVPRGCVISKHISIFEDLSSDITIGYAGQLYCEEEWAKLLSMLDGIDWRLGGRRVRILFVGYDYNYLPKNHPNISIVEFTDQKNAIQLMSLCDVLYLPYFFDEKRRVLAETSFPSKLSAYMASSVPILFHGPEYSSPLMFLKSFPDSCFCCVENTADALCNSLVEIFSDKIRYEMVRKNALKVLCEYLLDDIVIDKMNKFCS